MYDDTWYLVRIDFESGSGGYLGLAEDTYNVWIDGVLEASGASFYDSGIDFINKTLFGTGGGGTNKFYIDAFGLTSLGYDIGDNENSEQEAVEWTYRKEITIDHDKVESDLTNTFCTV